jgi:hypothetical protein
MVRGLGADAISPGADNPLFQQLLHPFFGEIKQGTKDMGIVKPHRFGDPSHASRASREFGARAVFYHLPIKGIFKLANRSPLAEVFVMVVVPGIDHPVGREPMDTRQMFDLPALL